ncbi:hypothetical protein M427DRAFT_347333 [Gonapodya prolifera JEL478]|uniref:Poly(A)-specific ribonuclease RNA-binding domain-containing protein n=1 Tax=Gonapodya prolifera (strain JEL478) TaxID=1344416 RepID=A0A139AVW5_GONPJ|nr:hypothetical protein M427DRAFT_347333 [Gonapodya prolifera JEL478]|eukprot:KXS20870.1 hypothetical protein M427DRAFT_347333 [Gonapodya prolifera JEL478]
MSDADNANENNQRTRRTRGFGGVYISPHKRSQAFPDPPAVRLSSPHSDSTTHQMKSSQPSSQKPTEIVEDDWESLADDVGKLRLSQTNSDTRRGATSNERKAKVPAGESGGKTKVLKISSFPASWKAHDIENIYKAYVGSFRIKWIDDTSAYVIFRDVRTAAFASSVGDPFIVVTPHSEPIKDETTEEEVERGPRPVTTDLVARRLISGALGINVRRTSEGRKAEEAKLAEVR